MADTLEQDIPIRVDRPAVPGLSSAPRFVRVCTYSLPIESFRSRADERRKALEIAWQMWRGECDVLTFATLSRPWTMDDLNGKLWGGLDTTYFMRMEVSRSRRRCPIKIGRSNDPSARREKLLTGSPFPITLLACAPCAVLSEGVAQAMFRRSRLRGEWYRWSPGLDDLITQTQRIMEMNPRSARREDNG